VSILIGLVPDRQDAQHVDDATTLHLDHDFEELQFARRPLRGHGLGKPAVARHGRHARVHPVVLRHEVAEPVAHRRDVPTYPTIDSRGAREQ
jgi:hypothetical protein